MKSVLSTLWLFLLSGNLALAQEEQKRNTAPTPVQQNFNMPSEYVNVRDYAYLPNNARMIVELTNPEQYRELANLDSVLKVLLNDIYFYKDSLENGAGSVRIDYTIDEAFSFNKVRFRKYAPDGDIFMTRPEDKARLKLDQDTIQIYFRHSPAMDDIRKPVRSWNYSMSHTRLFQVTFCVNNFTDLAIIAGDKATLQHALDTLYATKKKKTKQNPYTNPSSARYNPYAPDNTGISKRWLSYADVRFKQYEGLVKSDNAKSWEVLHRTDILTTNVNLGMGLIRNRFATGNAWAATVRQ